MGESKKEAGLASVFPPLSHIKRCCLIGVLFKLDCSQARRILRISYFKSSVIIMLSFCDSLTKGEFIRSVIDGRW